MPEWPSCISDRPKNTNVAQDVVVLLPVKRRWILFSDVENVWANQRPGRPSCFSDLLKEQKLGRHCWYLASCQVFLNYIKGFQRRRRIRGQGGHLVFSDRTEKHGRGTGRWDLASCQASMNYVQWFQRRYWKCLSQSEARAAILFFGSTKKQKLGRQRFDLFFNFVEFHLAVSEEKSKMYQPIRGHSSYLVFWIGPKNMVEDVEILLSIKFR